jgi:aminoglycoside phosphotransferase (APT) family kinase protein
MQPSQPRQPPRTAAGRPPPEIVEGLRVRVDRYLGGRANLHWLVSARDRPLVLRRYQPQPLAEVAYELRVLHRLAARGWPVPVAVAEPRMADGRVWCLFRWLPGAPQRVTGVPAEQRARGRLLAELHADLETLADLGQRPGWRRAEAVLADEGLASSLRAYGRLFPEQARVMRWHADRARECFDRLDLRHRRLLVLHGDFLPQNLLYRSGALSGVLDFEWTHLNHRASEFALAWRGRHDAVVHGYDEVRPLDDLDRALLAPTLWSWLFLGVAEEIRRMLAGGIEPHGFDWRVSLLLRRSPLMGAEAAPYL